ncbi:hypothetical protein GCM10007854_25730 [Algimonas porphyrae]|uniref:Uncharacterized protein n=1 Tax=Algimonas porphyrae TaxID=1128113 RepID=A0ABQ5V235_9PROT|nr:hypothetical protein GCM10007854_25730 [Algimonas porphyrae]
MNFLTYIFVGALPFYWTGFWAYHLDFVFNNANHGTARAVAVYSLTNPVILFVVYYSALSVPGLMKTEHPKLHNSVSGAVVLTIIGLLFFLAVRARNRTS